MSSPAPKSRMSRGLKVATYSVLLVVILVAFTLLFDVHSTGKLVHETLGLCIVLMVGYHIYHNAWFFKELFTKKKDSLSAVTRSRYSNPYFIFFDLTIVLLVIDFVFVIVTGLMTSVIYFGKINAMLGLPGSKIVRPYHALAVFLLFPLIGLHLGLHLHSLFGMLKSVYHKGVVLAIKLGLILMAIHGIMCFRVYDFAPKFSLIRSKSLRLMDPSLPSWLFICDLVCMGAFFVVLGYVISNYLLMRGAKEDN